MGINSLTAEEMKMIEAKRLRDKQRREREGRSSGREGREGQEPREGKEPREAKDGKDGREGKSRSGRPSRRLDIIDQLDATSIYGTGLFHHDGPFDALNPHRNRKTSRRAPMHAFPKDSLNNSIGGAGPLNANPDHAVFMGNATDEAFRDYAGGGKNKNGYNYPGPSNAEAAIFDPIARGSIVHGDESVGLGTSTFLEGTPAARTAIARRQAEQAQETFEVGVQRKKSLAQRIRHINRGPRDITPSGRLTNPDGGPSRRSPESLPTGTSVGSDNNPFFAEFSKGEETLSVKPRDGTLSPTSPPPPVPRRGSSGGPLERRATTDATMSEEAPAKPMGILGRMKSLKGLPSSVMEEEEAPEAAAAAADSSQASSHLPLDPLPATVLAARELARRNAARALGPCGVGCVEVDDEALLGAGGLERGTVVGVSCEDEDGFGLTLGLQVVARTLLAHAEETALVVTPRPAGVMLRALRDGIIAELRAGQATEKTAATSAAVAAAPGDGGVGDSGGGDDDEASDDREAAAVRACLDQVMLSCVFDVDGLWEVLAELDRPAETSTPLPESSACEEEDDTTGGMMEDQSQEVEERISTPPAPVLEIQDSEDEGLTPSPEPYLERPPEEQSPLRAHPEPGAGPSTSVEDATGPGGLGDGGKPGGGGRGAHGPSIVLVTHFSALLTSLFAHREKSAAHSSLQLLASQARYLSRSLPSQPLFVFLNSTSSSSSAHDAGSGSGAGGHPAAELSAGPDTAAAARGGRPEELGAQYRDGGRGGGGSRSARPLDPTLRSVFNPPPLPLPAYRAPRATTRRNKPSFGLIFSQMLDTHLLCTRLPRTKADADALYGANSSYYNNNDSNDNNHYNHNSRKPLHEGTTDHQQQQHHVQQHGYPGVVEYVTVVEVLLDEMGLWQGRLGPRPNREQRWGVVDVVGGRVVDAFARTAGPVYAGEIRTSGGFGGRRP
ncbi:protein phosphatase-1 [Purpureocillium lavendulum]|uniref:Protein phosphatase-1 n=1 Tax=Purpureocillium lavendulum TaxID=1247861 RepID=A0AB34G0X8_9HYPO|nr:protein phosphatase-1 [Purpureocillium lavendulum]